MSKKIVIQTETAFDVQRVSDLLCGAFEGGSNYWYRIEKFIKPVNFDNTEPDDREFRHLSYPTNEGGALIISSAEADGEPDEGEELETYRLDLEALSRGLRFMSISHPRHYANFVNENDDAETSDVFLQCCLFGKIIYG